MDSGAGQSMCACSEAFQTMRPCCVMIVGVAGSMPAHGIGTAIFVVKVSGKEHVLKVHNCLYCHGEECFNLISVSQLLRAGKNKVIFSQDESQVIIQEDDRATPLSLWEEDGLYEIQAIPLCCGDDRAKTLLSLNLTLEDDPQLWDGCEVNQTYAHMKSPTKLGRWQSKMLWVSCKVGLQGRQSMNYDDKLNEFCDSYFVPPSQPPARKTYKTTDVEDMADLSLRFMGVGTDRLRHTLERSRGLTPATRKKGANTSVVPPLNFPQGKWKAGKTPRVKKGKVENLYRASIAEVCFTDTFETDDGTYKYGQAVVDYRSRYGDVFPIRTRKKVAWAIGEFCCRHFVPLILIRDNIAENVGGELDAECHRRGIKSAFSCPYTPQQDYAEGYLGRVIMMASFAMVFSGAPMFMWRWAIISAAFINNITATYYKKEKVWATPWEVLHGEPFPDSSIVVPFGCAALVLLNKEERVKFKGTCVMMIFVHYALNHPLYTYALYSPRTKRVVFRQDVIFLPSVFPMRVARVSGGLAPDGERLIAYRSPKAPGTMVDEDTSFEAWESCDPLPPYQDDVTGYPLVSPLDGTDVTSEERQPEWPKRQPDHPSFGPQSVVKINVPWGDKAVNGQREVRAEEQIEMGRGDNILSPKKQRPKRTARIKPLSTTVSAPKRIPVNQRWSYEPIAQQAALLAPSAHAGEEGVEGGDEQSGRQAVKGEEKLLDNNLFCPQETDGNKNFEISSDQLEDQEITKSDRKKEKDDIRASRKNKTFDLLTGNKCFEDKTGIDPLGPLRVFEPGTTELIPYEIVEEAADDEATACGLQGMIFHDSELGMCTVTNWGVDYGTNILYYAPVDSTDRAGDEHHIELTEILAQIQAAPVPRRVSGYRASRRLGDFSCKKNRLINALFGTRSIQNFGTVYVRPTAKVASSIKALSTRVLRRILKAQETLFKYGTMIPRSDREAEASPEAVRWKSGRQLEWLRLLAAKTFETDWTWERICKEYPEYKRSEIGHMFYIYDYKYSGEHRVRLVFDGSRQSPNTYSITYAPTVRAESVRLFHLYAVEYAWEIQQYDVPQAFLRSDADCTIFVYPPNGQSDFPGQILKLSKMLYGSKQAAALWYNLLNSFLLKLGFIASSMDPCFYRRRCSDTVGATSARSDAIIILHVDDMRVAATADVLKEIHAQLYAEFQITTSDSGRFLGMDTEYDIQSGVFKMHMATYIDSTVQRFKAFDVSMGIPYRELVGSLLWIVLCVMGTELLRVKDLARRSNDYTMDDYNDAMQELDRIVEQKHYGIIFRRGGAGREYVPASTRLGGGFENVNEEISYSTGDAIAGNDLEETNLYKLDPMYDDEQLDIDKVLADTNPRFTKVAYSDASFAVGLTKQSITGFVVMINGVPILWGSLKQTIVVDSTCSAEYVAASVCCKQVMQAENMVQFLDFTCPRPYTMYTDSQACLKIATTASKMGMVRHLEIRYHLVRCIVLSGNIKLFYCITEEMLADLFTKIVANAQDKRLAVRFYNDCVMD